MKCMEINEYSKVEIIFQNHIQEDPFKRRKRMNILMKCIQMVLTDMKEQVIQKEISNVEISTTPLRYFQIVILFWVVVETSKK